VNAFVRRRPLLSYFVLAYAITWAVAAPLLLSSRGFIDTHAPEWLEPLAAFGPFVAAMLIARALNGGEGPAAILSSLTRWRVRPVWFVFALGSPVVILGAALLIVPLPGGQFVDPERGRLGELASAAGLFDLIVIGAILQAWGEEPGWRGFALPQLRERFGPLAATLALFPVWLCWHLPFFLSRPGFGLSQWLGFSLGILSAAIWLTLIWDRTRSVLMCLGWHAMVNICRGLALAMSTAMFLAFSNTVLFGALLIAGFWLVFRRTEY
jgi:membrane protease YdiL (CAAX protease family)